MQGKQRKREAGKVKMKVKAIICKIKVENTEKTEI